MSIILGSIPEGWMLITVDMTGPCEMSSWRKARVTLTRSYPDRTVWWRLSNVGKDRHPMQVDGYGDTLEEAWEASIENALGHEAGLHRFTRDGDLNEF